MRTTVLLAFAIAASQVDSGQGSYPCVSDADCQYEGCNNRDCSSAVSTHPNIDRCNDGVWDAECRCIPSCICMSWGPDGDIWGSENNCPPKRDCPDGYLFSNEGFSVQESEHEFTGIATSADCGERCDLLPGCYAFGFSASLARCELKVNGFNHYQHSNQKTGFISCERIETTTPAPTPMPGRWYHCANEGQVCTCHGRVRYGGQGAFSEPQQVAGQITCADTIFGDPISGVVKTCECDPSEQSTYDHYARACVTEANIQLYPGKTPAECANLCDARGEECKGFEFGVDHGVTFPAEKLCSSKAECDYSGCNDRPCTSQTWRCPAFPVHTFGCVWYGYQKCMYGGWDDYPDWTTCPYPASDFQPGDCRLKSSANMQGCSGMAFNGDFYAKVSSSSSSSTPAPTTSSSSSSTPAPTTSSSSSSTPAPTTSSSSSSTPAPTTSSSSSSTPAPTTSSSSSSTPAPTTSSSSSSTPAPTTSSSSSSTPAPTTSSSSSSTPAPTTSSSSSSTPAPTTSSSSSSTPAPTTSSSSSSTPAPTTSSSSSSTPAPTTSSSSSSTPAPTTSSSSSSTPAPTTSSSSSSTPAPTTSSSSSSTPAPTTSSSSSSTPAPTTSSSSSSTPAPTTSSSSSSTPAPTTSSSSSSTPAPITSSSSSSTPAPTTSSSSSSTPAPTTSSSSSSTPAPTTSSSSSSTPAPTTSSSSSSMPEVTPFNATCKSGTLPFTGGGASICVPSRLYPAQSVAHCVFDQTWQEVSQRWEAFFTGALGQELVAGEWEVWLCGSGSDVQCASERGGLVCFTYSEAHEVFVPWGDNSDLLLV